MAEIIRSYHPALKQFIKAAIPTIAADPACSKPLRREPEGLRKYRVRRFRIIDAVNHKAGAVRCIAVGHRRSLSEELTDRIRKRG
ncbi:MAG: type II toxin-antitoxin system RelE/ParE family toxin [Nitrospira sp.]|nr:type II toxin-antitoxin system RelE/ParE family toxin [Nitrospira sp.]MDR4474963.1 type II toxin-antitoxin system RelE/ParE family toxin [Nitrospira sp.]